MQEIEQRPQRQIDRKEQCDLIEAHDEARRPASAQQRELQPAAQIARKSGEQARRCRGHRRLELAIR
jgi:hypothetical protein